MRRQKSWFVRKKYKVALTATVWAPPACLRSVQLDVWVWHWNCLSSTILTYEPGPKKHSIRMKYFCDWPKLEKQPLPCEGGSGIRMCCCVWERVEPRKRIFVVATEIYFLKNLSHHSCKLLCLCIKHVPLQGNWKPNRQSSTFLNTAKGLCWFARNPVVWFRQDVSILSNVLW